MTDLFQHERDAYADGVAGKDFTPPAYLPFRLRRVAVEDAWAAWSDGRAAFMKGSEQ